jgi:hypothetical protein
VKRMARRYALCPLLEKTKYFFAKISRPIGAIRRSLVDPRFTLQLFIA